MKIKIVTKLLDLTYRRSLKNTGVYLAISLLDCLTIKKFQDFSRTFPKFQQNSRTFQNFPKLFSNSRTFQDFPGLVGTMKIILDKFSGDFSCEFHCSWFWFRA